MKCREIIEVLERKWPPTYALDWDNVGLLVGEQEQEIKHIMVALDLTEEILEEAIRNDVDMVVTHHPMIFSGIKKVTSEDMTTRRVIRLIQQGMCCYAMHTNFDILTMAYLNQQAIGLVEASVLQETGVQEDGHKLGIGRIGKVTKEGTLEAFATYVKESLQLPNILVYGDMQQIIKIAAISGGSGKSAVKPSIQKGADVLITGDIDYHTAIDAVAQKLCIIDAGHYGTEYVFVNFMQGELARIFTEVKVSGANIRHPYQVV